LARVVAEGEKPADSEVFSLQLYCQEPGQWHPALDGGMYEIDTPVVWFRHVAPLLRGIIKVLPLAMPAAGWVAPFAGSATIKSVEEFEQFYKVDIEFTNELCGSQGSSHAGNTAVRRQFLLF